MQAVKPRHWQEDPKARDIITDALHFSHDTVTAGYLVQAPRSLHIN